MPNKKPNKDYQEFFGNTDMPDEAKEFLGSVVEAGISLSGKRVGAAFQYLSDNPEIADSIASFCEHLRNALREHGFDKDEAEKIVIAFISNVSEGKQ